MLAVIASPQHRNNTLLRDVLNAQGIELQILPELIVPGEVPLPDDLTTPAIFVIDVHEFAHVRPIVEAARRRCPVAVIGTADPNDAEIYEPLLPELDDLLMTPLNASLFAHRLKSQQNALQKRRELETLRERYRDMTAMNSHYFFSYKQIEPGVYHRVWSERTPEADRLGLRTDDEYMYRDGWMTHVHPDHHAAFIAFMQRLAAGLVSTVEYRSSDVNGDVVWLRQVIYPSMDPETGHMSGFTGMLQEITNHKSIEMLELEQRQMIEAMQQSAFALSSALDLDTVLDNILDSIATVIQFDFADVMLIEGGQVRFARQHGYRELGIPTLKPQGLMLRDLPLFMRQAQVREPMLIPDVRQVGDWVAFLETRDYITAYMGMPLFLGERLAGFVSLNRCDARPFTQVDAVRLEFFAGQVAAAISNAQLYDTVVRHSNELEERIRDLLVIYEIGRMLNGTLDLNEVYRMTYHEVAQRLFRSQDMQVLLYNRETETVQPVYAVIDGLEADVDTIPPRPLGDDPASQTIRTHIPCIESGVMYEPLVSRDRIIGVLQIQQHFEQHIDEVDFTLLSTVASQVAIALENARLYMQVHSHIQELTALYTATSTLFQADTLDTLVQQITVAVVTEFQHADCGLLLLNDTQSEIVEVFRAGSYQPQTEKSWPLNDQGPEAQACKRGRPIYVPDIISLNGSLQHHQGGDRMRSHLVIPLSGGSGVLGALDLRSPDPDAFSEQDQRVLQAFAERAGSALENRQLYNRITQYADELEKRVEERTNKLWEALHRERLLGDLRSRFLQTVNHAFRTPLTAILSSSESLERYQDRMSDEQRQGKHNAIRISVHDMVRMMEDATTMSQATDGTLRFSPQPIDLGEVTARIVKDFIDKDGRNHIVMYNVEGDVSIAIVDENLWRKVVMEMLLNAAKYSSEGSEINCTLQATDDQIRLCVTDQGIGIPVEDQPHVFELFHRGINAINIAGTGLGLSIVEKTVNLHGGAVVLQSEPGNGTTITVNIPRYATRVDSDGTDENPRN